MLELHSLRKEFDGLVAVRDLSFRLEPGDIFGFIGPNGAGKTTTIKMVATLLDPTSGTASVDGVDVVRYPERARPVLGFMPDSFGVYDDFKVWEYLDFFAAAYQVPRANRARLISDALELTDLGSKRDSYVEMLSRGMRQRLCLAKTLVHDPKVLLLDEPASGLDPRARAEIKDLLRELRRLNKTILISSHILPELADFCNKVGIIEQGALVAFGEISEMQAKLSGHVLEVQFADEAEVLAAQAFLAGLPSVAGVSVTDGALLLTYQGEPGKEHEVLQALVGRGFKVSAFSEQKTDLEDIFLKLTKGIVS